MSNGRIDIVIGSDAPENQEPSTKFEEENIVDKQTESVKRQSGTNLVLAQAGKQILQKSIANYGNITGDYATQETINTVIEVAGIATSAIAVMPLGPVAAATVVGLQLGFKGLDRALEINKSNYKVRNLRERVGTNTTYGSR